MGGWCGWWSVGKGGSMGVAACNGCSSTRRQWSWVGRPMVVVMEVGGWEAWGLG